MFSSGRVRDPSVYFSQEAIAVTAHAGVAKNNGTPVAVYKGLGMNSVLANSANSYDEWGGTSCHSKPKSSVNGYVFLPCSFHALADVRGVAHPENYIAMPFFCAFLPVALASVPFGFVLARARVVLMGEKRGGGGSDEGV
jgi:hypothetical protein